MLSDGPAGGSAGRRWRRLFRPARGLRTGLLTGLLCLPLPAAAGSEVDRFLGQRVVEVEFAIAGSATEPPAIRELVETRVGEPLAMRQVRETLAHLFSLGRYGAVEVGASSRPGGVALLYELRPFEFVTGIELEGGRVLSPDDVRRVISRTYGETFLANEAVAVADTVRAYYGERGYLSARVFAEVAGRGSRRVLRLSIEAGPRATVRRWLMTGVPSPSLYESVRALLGFEDGAPYDGASVDRQLGDYQSDLRRIGYYEASLSHEADLVSDAEVDVRLLVRRGPRITVSFEGDSVPGASLPQLVPIEREASVDEDLLEDAEQRIEGHLRSLGYRDAVVTHTRGSDADRLSIVFRVSRGPLYRVAEVAVEGNRAVPDDELRTIAGVAPGDALVVADLDAGLAAIEEHYRRLGFATVRATSSFSGVAANGDGIPVSQAVEIAIEEGVRTTIGTVRFDGAAIRSPQVLLRAIESRAGGAYHQRQSDDDRDALVALYLNEGYEQVRVAVDSRFAEDLSVVDLTFRIAEGPQVLVDHVLIVGNEEVDTETIRREVTLAPGQPLGLAEVAETRRRLNALGMFRRLDIREFSHGRVDRRDVIIEVEEAAATRLAYGGGFELSQRLRRQVRASGSQAVERIELAPRGSFEIGRRNLWGKNRSIDLFTRVSVRRKNDPPLPVQSEPGRALGFNEYRVLATYREPRAIGQDWDVVMTGYVEQAIRPGFDLFSRGVTAQLTRSSGAATSTAVGYRLGNNDTSNRELNREDEDIVDRLFPNVRLSSFTGSQVVDTRDDPVDPARGTFVTLEAEVAARTIGSEVGFTKSFLSGAVYRRVPGVPRVVMAAGARLGVAWGFPRSLDVASASDDAQRMASSLGLPISERFFAGGNTTVRGFALDRLGDPRTRTGGTIDQDGFPQGGNAMVIFNSELRIRVTPAIGVVTFLDAGNVYDRVEHVSLGRIRSGAGFGVRYNSPIGPLGFDIGFKLGPRYFFGDQTSPQQEQLWALHFSFGQAF